MKSWIVSVLFIIGIVFLINKPVSAQAASNCGVPYTGTGSPPPNSSSKCCGDWFGGDWVATSGTILGENNTPQAILKNIPGIGGIFSVLPAGFVNLLNVKDLPKSFFPAWPFITLGDLAAPMGLETTNNSSKYCTGGVVIGYPGKTGCYCRASENDNLASIGQLCRNITDPGEMKLCYDCIGIEIVPVSFLGVNYTAVSYKEGRGVWTGLGCIDKNLQGFVQNVILGYGLGFAGLASFLCVIYTGFQYSLSRGNSEKIKKAQELLTSCLIGLLFIIFSVLILRIIGVDLLRIPGLS